MPTKPPRQTLEVHLGGRLLASEDANIAKAHARYLEAQLIALATDAA